MLESRRLPLWAGRTAALLGIVLVAFTLRQAVAAVSPIIGDIRTDFPVSNLDVSLLGTLPPLLFAISGFTAPRVARRIGLDGGIVLALVLITVGHLVRAVAPGVAMLLVGSIVAFARTGVGNVLLPSVVRRYFPDRVALLTAVYACIVGVSTAVPAALAAPIAQYSGWRTSLAVCAVTSTAALVPWHVVLTQQRRLPHGRRSRQSRTHRGRHSPVAITRRTVDHRALLLERDLHLRGLRLATRDPAGRRQIDPDRGGRAPPPSLASSVFPAR
ncbi:CynX/NimT family MFS transporter [Curtobacterium sp. MCPF17_052]|uniref:MFS transporter n=1 Tax=Curtobacterium sp. MCPF17_052 TaxID=2175655 RepID=UPI0024DF52F0|nr:MFS transporter [Curtobacterium sp. MCPF17_052]WIB13458.1 MFS transporter [Curtobacterium sp. MCPF17_052]